MMTSSISTQDIFDASNSRAAQRKARLMQIEYQQQLEDMEALKMSEEQRYSLMQSFSSVKVEFCDLDGLQWTGSALRKRTVSRPDSSSGILSQRLNLNENFPRRARAQTLFCPSSPSISSASSLPSSSYFPSLDTSHPSSNCRGSEALAVLNNVGFAPGFDEKTVRAVVSPVKAALVSQKHSVSSRESDSRPPAKQRRRSRSPVKDPVLCRPQFPRALLFTLMAHPWNASKWPPRLCGVESVCEGFGILQNCLILLRIL
ncbi:hypothetical protein DFJ43DRAFT_52028 [Lentinula guzmanii]|uniref:Uncharacterized protein n=1 Tax=Lentinula guzmanii TaxID=2804957 RepID=A0AA38J6Q5_9AGAR|nr:hypothetical protein DFJ43DRAFT_52028 [Lentinula guzmanii]